MDNQTDNNLSQPNQPDVEVNQAPQTDEATEQTQPVDQIQPDQINQTPVDEKPLDLSSQKSKLDLSQPFSWQATEYVQYNYGTSWYAIFGLVAVGLLAIAIFVIKDLLFTILIPIMAVAVILLIRRPPGIISYSISPKGIQVGEKLHDFAEFKSFGVLREPTHSSVMLLPIKRLGTSVVLYFDESDGEMIVDLLGARLPMVDAKPNLLDKIARLARL